MGVDGQRGSPLTKALLARLEAPNARFFNDMLIAASARELGAVILTENREDFDIISNVLDIRHIEPWPAPSTLR